MSDLTLPLPHTRISDALREEARSSLECSRVSPTPMKLQPELNTEPSASVIRPVCVSTVPLLISGTWQSSPPCLPTCETHRR